jgi:hypothetical protein
MLSATPFCTACTHDAGALATRRSALRAPWAASASYLENTALSESVVTVTWIFGYCLLNSAMTGLK